MLLRLIVASTYQRKSIITSKICNSKSKTPGHLDLEGLHQPRRLKTRVKVVQYILGIITQLEGPVPHAPHYPYQDSWVVVRAEREVSVGGGFRYTAVDIVSPWRVT